MIPNPALASAPLPTLGAAAPASAPDEHHDPIEPSPSSGSSERNSGHWLDLALALWLEDSPVGHTPSQSAGDH